ncbi:MAG: hypothetical protein IPI60_07595 [Saprospiraceae bacterium]|nr:hypothetical protein [Saprospiraceae bacterium]
MIHPGFISREPNVEIFLKNIRAKIEKDFHKPSILWALPSSLLSIFILSFFSNFLENVDWIYRTIALFILGAYFGVAMPLLRKKKIESGDDHLSLRENFLRMKSYYILVHSDRWRFIVIAILSILYSGINVFYLDPGIEIMRESTSDAIFGVFRIVINVYLVIVVNAFYLRKKNASRIIDLEHNYKEMGVNL